MTEVLQQLKKQLQNHYIVVAEDSPINQQIAQEFLSDTGVDFDIVENGQELIELLKLRTADLILMDLQMPILDGFEATKILRQSSQYARLPIIAMTGDTSEAQIAACMEAGMNGHLNKSFDPEPLYQIIAEYLCQSDASSSTAEIINLDKINQQVNHKLELRNKLLNNFLSHHRHDIDLLQEAIRQQERSLAHRSIHTLYGLLASLGANDELCSTVKTLNARWQDSQHKIQVQELETFIPLFQSFVNAVEGVVEIQNSGQASSGLKPFSKQDFAIVFDELAAHISNYSPEASLSLDKILIYQLPQALQEDIDSLKQSLDLFDFPSCEEKLIQISTTLCKLS